MRMRELWHRLRAMTRRDALESGLDEEIRFHLDQQVEKNLRAGMTPDEARRRALVRFGGVEQVRESTRDQFRAAFVQDSLQDLRHGARALRRAPAFTLVAVLTLACGIGATTAVFTVVQGVLIKPLPYVDADDLVSLKHTALDTKAGPVGVSAALLVTYARENRSFRQIGVWSRGTANLTGGVLPEEVASISVSAGTLPALGVQPMAGRWFSTEDHTPGSAETVILTHGYWQRRFGGDPSVVGRQVTIDATPRTVVAVMPAGFRFLDDTPEIILPLRFEPGTLTLGGFSYEGIARLAPGVTVENARVDLARMVPIWVDEWPTFPGVDRSVFVDAQLTPLVRPLKEELVGDVGDVLWVLMGTIGIVLVVACANVANLALVRAEGRHHELATRTALGASPLRVARAMLLESLLLGVAGGALGVPLAWAGLRLLAAFAPAALPRLHEIEIDATVLIFTAAVSVVSALFFGGVPVLRHAGRGVASALRAGGRGASAGRERQRARNALVVAQVALAVILLVGSGLMVRTFVALRAVEPGFSDPHHVQLVRVTIPEAHVADPERVFHLQRDMRDRLAAIPGVSDVSFTGNVPMAAGERSRSSIEGEGAGLADGGRLAELRWFRYVAPGLFRTIGTPLVAGRDFTWTDLEEYRPVAVISENLAREMWGEPAAALGRRVREGTASPWREVVGVVADVHDNGLREEAPRIAYWPSIMESFLGQEMNVRRSVTFAIRSDRAATDVLLTEVREAIRAVDAGVPLTRVRTLGDVYDRSMVNTRFTLVMLAIAAAMALGLGVVGIYGVIAYAVAQRRREIGIRVALGASPRDVRRVFVRHGVVLGLCGTACGAAGAALLTRLIGSLLFATSPLDPTTYAFVALGLVAITALASYVPAHAATRVDPAQTLRGD